MQITSVIRHLRLSAFVLTLLGTPILAQESAQADVAQDEPLWGHSSHGAAYDEGPRQRPWKMEGIGTVSFPITSSVPEVQAWFDQGMALMHGFWDFEAERSFRWCLKLDADCAMAYWGMSLATRRSRERTGEFLARAVELKGQVTPRERAYIEVSEAFRAVEESKRKNRVPGGEKPEEDDSALVEATVLLDRLLMDYPDDVEAKAFYWLLLSTPIGKPGSEAARYGLEAVLDDILEVDPDHVGALHFRIHNWDGDEGRYAVDSCMKLGDIAPNCGHLLHMPGHVLSSIGLWHEAAISMDRATRVEKSYMHDRMIVPENNWDYVHNLDYLCYLQEQLGMADQALLGAHQLQLTPAFTEGGFMDVASKMPILRALVKFERWDELLDPGRIEWNRDSVPENILATYAEYRARIGLGQIEEAATLFEELEQLVAENPDGPGAGADTPPDPADFMVQFIKKQYRSRLPGLKGLLLVRQGEALEGLALLAEAARQQEEDWQNDPPHEATYFYNLLGDEYLALGAPSLAVDCYERTLETIFHDGFALAGLVVAHSKLGDEASAREAMARLEVVWSDAQPNRWLAAAEATGVEAEPFLEAPVAQRNYKKEVLDIVGPSLCTRGPAPELQARNARGESVSLEDYKGKNVLAIFYLGDECIHCMEQIAIAEERMGALEELNTVVLAISKDGVEEIAAQAEDFELTLLSDPSFETARRFRSFDDFEEIELHSTFIIDPKGRVHWSRIGGAPFSDFDFLEGELKRLNRDAAVHSSDEAPRHSSIRRVEEESASDSAPQESR